MSPIGTVARLQALRAIQCPCSELAFQKGLAAIAVLGIVFIPLPTLADNDAEACKPDVFRLCSAAIPWRDRIVACLHENKRKLSPAC